MNEVNFDLMVAIKRKYLTQMDAGWALQIPESQISHLVRGRRQPTPEERRKLAKALGKDYFEPQGPRVA